MTIVLGKFRGLFGRKNMKYILPFSTFGFSVFHEVERVRGRKAKDDVEHHGREGHERAWFEKRGCTGA